MAVEPLVDLWMLVRCVVVEDHINRLARRSLRLDGVEEADELLMPMPLHVATDVRAAGCYPDPSGIAFYFYSSTPSVKQAVFPCEFAKEELWVEADFRMTLADDFVRGPAL